MVIEHSEYSESLFLNTVSLSLVKLFWLSKDIGKAWKLQQPQLRSLFYWFLCHHRALEALEVAVTFWMRRWLVSAVHLSHCVLTALLPCGSFGRISRALKIQTSKQLLQAASFFNLEKMRRNSALAWSSLSSIHVLCEASSQSASADSSQSPLPIGSSTEARVWHSLPWGNLYPSEAPPKSPPCKQYPS